MIEATPLDVVLLSGVVGLAKASGVTASAFETFDKALTAGKVPVSGKVSDRVVRSAYAALERSSTKMSLDNIPNPLPAPHNLSWYFSSCACPPDIRQFATMLGRGNIRVWSVARDMDGWYILVQVFGTEDSASAVKAVELETRLPVQRLKGYALDTISPFELEASNVEKFMHDYAKNILKNKGLGTFVELFIERRM